jgi:putative NIF3 family GTP cyclohydrolase 1 type 2
MEWKGVELGVSGKMDLTLGELGKRVSKSVGGPLTCCGDKNNKVGKVGIITGGAGSEIEKVADQGIQTFITGEGPHWSHPLAEELGLNFLYAGHYATEIFGVKALADRTEISMNLPDAVFIDHPTGL